MHRSCASASAGRCSSPTGARADGDLSASGRRAVSWDLSGTYNLNEDVNLYARVATGFRGSSIQGRSAVRRLDVGRRAGNRPLRSRPASRPTCATTARRLNAGVFHYEVKDQQLTAVGGAANANILINAEKTVGQGFELDFQAYLTDNLLVTLGSSYNDTEIKDADLASRPAAVGCTRRPIPIRSPRRRQAR